MYFRRTSADHNRVDLDLEHSTFNNMGELLQHTIDGTTLPRIGYIFSGYDIHKSNPYSTRGVDPGFRTIPIFQSNYSCTMTSDRMSILPNRVWARQTLFVKNQRTWQFLNLQVLISLRIHASFFSYASMGLYVKLKKRCSLISFSPYHIWPSEQLYTISRIIWDSLHAK